MHTLLVTVHVVREHAEALLAATLRNHEGSTRGPGSPRFDLAWREAVAPWMAAAREGKRWEIVAPADRERRASTR